MKIQKIIFVLPICCFILFSCSKEEDEVKLSEHTSYKLDTGHLSIVFSGSPAIVDSVVYFNQTKLTASNIPVTNFFYDQPNNRTFLSLPIANGNINDQVRCCVALNSSTNIGIVFTSMHTDSIPTAITGSSNFCQSGIY